MACGRVLHSCKRAYKKEFLDTILTGPKPKEIKVETFRIDYLIRKVEFTANKDLTTPSTTQTDLPD